MNKSILYYSVNFVLGAIFSFIGFINTFWGNDPFYGLFIILISIIFYLPLINLVLDKIPQKAMLIIKIILGFFIVWSSLGVGELFNKIELMEQNFPLPKNDSPYNNFD
ncbi:MAG: hypothetical protein R6V36_08040 [Psychroflexus sp.]